MQASSDTQDREAPVEPSRGAVRRLILAKHFLSHAIEHSLRQGPFDSVVAVHNLHNAIEIVIRTVALEYQVKTFGHDIGLGKLADDIKKSPAAATRGLEVPHMQAVLELGAWRNLAQHAATEPDKERMAEWRLLAQSFLRESALMFFGLDIDEIGSADLIANLELRGLLQHADGLQSRLAASMDDLASDDQAHALYQTALATLAISFAFTFGAARWYLPFAVVEKLVDVPSRLGDLANQSVEAHLWERIRELELAALCQLLAIDYWAYQELDEHAPVILLDGDDKPWLMVLNEASADPHQIRRLIDAQVNTVLSLEERGWLPEQIGLHKGAYDRAAAVLLAKGAIPLAGRPDEPKEPFKLRADLGSTIRSGYPGFMLNLDL